MDAVKAKPGSKVTIIILIMHMITRMLMIIITTLMITITRMTTMITATIITITARARRGRMLRA